MRFAGAFLGACLGACGLLSAVPAFADDPVPPGPALPTPTVLRISPFLGEPTGGPPALPPSLAIMPLRLSLVGASFPLGPSLGDRSCDSSMATNSQWGFPLQHQVYMALTPRLVLHGFSQLGCTIDAGAGGGVSYSVPLTDKLWLVGALGAYQLPNRLGGPVTNANARVDLLLRTTPQNVLGVGLDRHGIKITGTW